MYPHYPIVCCLPHLSMVAHNSQGKSVNLRAKRKRLTAKRITSRQKELKRLAAKRKTSRQKEKDWRQNFFDAERTFYFLFLLPWGRGYSFCREVILFTVGLILFAVRFFLLSWGFSFCREVFLVAWGFSFCCEIILFAVRFFFLPWGYSFCREVILFTVGLILFAMRLFVLPRD